MWVQGQPEGTHGHMEDALSPVAHIGAAESSWGSRIKKINLVWGKGLFFILYICRFFKKLMENVDYGREKLGMNFKIFLC